MPGIAARTRWPRLVAIGTAFLAVTACGLGFWSTRPRPSTDPLSRAASAYSRGQWTTAAELARQALTLRKDDPAALRLLARASARLGRDAPALAIYLRRVDEKGLEAEDYLLLGQLYQRQGRADAVGRAWSKVLEADGVSPRLLEELGRLYIQARRWDEALLVTERLSGEPGWEAHGSMMLGTIRVELNNAPAAALLFRRALDLDPSVLNKSQNPIALRKAIARTFLRTAGPAEARAVLQPILDGASDVETAWLMSRVFLQEGDNARALAALKQAGSYRADNPLEPEPGPYVGEARCENCHTAIFRDSLASRHTQTYYRGPQLDAISMPDGPLPDPDDPEVTHTFQKREGAIHEETRVGREVFDAVVEYAFGTGDRYLTAVSRDTSGGYHISRLSYFQAPEGKGWDRSTLDRTHPTRARPAEFQGELIGVRDGLAKCLYCHVTNPRTGHDSLGPESTDRAIGCERCHGPGHNHIAALKSGFPDPAIVNPSAASPRLVTSKQCNDCHILDKRFRDDDPKRPGWARSQGVGWTLSRCNTESDGAFGCVTCHDPHTSARASTTAQYEAKCLGCHDPAGRSMANDQSPSKARNSPAMRSRSCAVSPSKGCIACHMPRVRIDSLHLELTDHFIRVDRQKH